MIQSYDGDVFVDSGNLDTGIPVTTDVPVTTSVPVATGGDSVIGGGRGYISRDGTVPDQSGTRTVTPVPSDNEIVVTRPTVTARPTVTVALASGNNGSGATSQGQATPTNTMNINAMIRKYGPWALLALVAYAVLES